LRAIGRRTTSVLPDELRRASARHAADLGYHVFVVADACRAVVTADLRERLWPAQDVQPLALVRRKGETETIVDVATTLRVAATAKAR
jgi:nicotinamidase-related amidase